MINANYLPTPRCDCGSQRVEVYDADGRHGRRVHITACLDCKRRHVEELAAEERLEPGSPKWEEAWGRDPGRIARHLTREEIGDPNRNPLHPNALGYAPTKKPPLALHLSARHPNPYR